MMNGEIRLDCYFFTNMKDNINEELISNEGKAKWVSVKEILELEI